MLAWFFVPHFPEKATFLQPSEKEWILRRLRADDREFAHEKMTRQGVQDALRDWKVLTSGVLYLAVCTTAYAISVFQPTILATFGWSSIKSNLLSAPPRVASAIVSVLCGIWSDRVQRRGIFCLGGFGVSTAGLILVAVLKGDLRYVGIYFAAIGIYICQPLAIAWTYVLRPTLTPKTGISIHIYLVNFALLSVNQVVSRTKQGTITAFAGTLGQVGGIISAIAFPEKDSPQYIPGIVICIAFQAVGIAAAINMWVFCSYENRQRAAGKRDHLRQLPREEQDKLGEKHPDFRYIL